MTMRALVAAVAAAWSLSAGCGSPPGSEQVAPFEWAIAASGLDEAVLSVCSGSDRTIAVGGAVGQPSAFEWDGSAWRGAVMPLGSELLWWCWIEDAGVAYAVGDMGTIIRSDAAGAWTDLDTAGVVPDDITLYGVWGSTASDVIVVGGAFRPGGNVAYVARFDGATWTTVTADVLPDEVLFKVWGASAADIWVVGTGGAALHWNGSAWTTHDAPTTDRLIAVWGTGPDDVYAVGGDAGGVVLRYDGAAWTVFDAAAERLSGVWTAPGEPLYVAGDRGYAARYERGADGEAVATKRATTTILPTVDFHSLTGAAGVVIASGSDLVGGNNAKWNGAIATHKGDRTGDVIAPTYPDAGPADAVPADAHSSDAAVSDATPADAGGLDAPPLPGPGASCAEPPHTCAEGLTCWQLLASGALICTDGCVDESACQAPGYGPTPCCTAPGPQTLETVCIPGSYGECGS